MKVDSVEKLCGSQTILVSSCATRQACPAAALVAQYACPVLHAGMFTCMHGCVEVQSSDKTHRAVLQGKTKSSPRTRRPWAAQRWTPAPCCRPPRSPGRPAAAAAAIRRRRWCTAPRSRCRTRCSPARAPPPPAALPRRPACSAPRRLRKIFTKYRPSLSCYPGHLMLHVPSHKSHIGRAQSCGFC